MGRSAGEAQMGNLVWNGKGPFQLDSGVLSFTTASQVKQGGCVAPCDAEIVAANVRILASATGASSKINIGLNANPSGLLTKFALLPNLASTIVDLMTASTWVATASKKVRKGDVIYFNVTKSTAVGSFAVSLMLQPR